MTKYLIYITPSASKTDNMKDSNWRTSIKITEVISTEFTVRRTGLMLGVIDMEKRALPSQYLDVLLAVQLRNPSDVVFGIVGHRQRQFSEEFTPNASAIETRGIQIRLELPFPS